MATQGPWTLEGWNRHPVCLWVVRLMGEPDEGPTSRLLWRIANPWVDDAGRGDQFVEGYAERGSDGQE